MSKKLAFVITLAGTFVLNSFAPAAAIYRVKDTKKHDKKPPVVLSVASSQHSEKKKKEDEKKQQIAVNEYRRALMKPASLRHFQQSHCRTGAQRVS